MDLYKNVVVVRAHITLPKERQVDKHVSKELCELMRAQEDSLVVQKRLFNLNGPRSWRDAARRLIRTRGIPWSAGDEVKREPLYAIAGKEIAEICELLSEYREKFFLEVHELIRSYAEILKDAERRLGKAYNPFDFPSANEFKDRFGWAVEINPVSTPKNIADDLRFTVPTKMVDEQIALAEQRLKDRIAGGVREVLRRTGEHLDNVAIALMAYEPGEDRRQGNTFRDVSIYDKLDSHAEWMRAMNEFLDDTIIADMITKIDTFRNLIRPRDPSVLRQDAYVRQKVADTLEMIAYDTRQ